MSAPVSTQVETDTTSNSLTKFIASSKDFVGRCYSNYDNYVSTTVHKYLPEKVASVAYRILQGLPVALFMALASPTVAITATLTVIFLQAVEPKTLNSKAGSVIFSGICLYSGFHAAAYLVKAVATEHLLSNLLTGLAYGAVSAYSYFQASECLGSSQAAKANV